MHVFYTKYVFFRMIIYALRLCFRGFGEVVSSRMVGWEKKRVNYVDGQCRGENDKKTLENVYNSLRAGFYDDYNAAILTNRLRRCVLYCCLSSSVSGPVN